MPGQLPTQASNPYVPDAPGPLIMEAFQGVNTSTTRAGVPDEMMYWCDGYIPLDQRNLRTLYGVGTTIYNAASAASTTVVFFTFANIGATPYCIIFLANGQVVAVNTTSLVATTILTAGTITTPLMTTCGTSQWGSQYLIIVADQSNGYWLWDGTNVYSSGTLSPSYSIINGGSGYPATVTVTASGGHGHGSSITASVFGGVIQSLSIINPGTGYSVNDVVNVAVTPAPSSGSGGTITASVNSSTGTLVALSIVSGGSLYNNPSLTFTGRGIGMAALAIVTGGSITNTSITNVGAGYITGGATVGIVDTSANATINLSLMPFGIQGTAVETYSGHVWVAKQALVQYTGPGLVADFSTASAGGNFTSVDSFLKVGFSRLVQSNGFLYLLGDSSINYISGIQTSGSPPVTNFTNQNADPAIGTPYPMSVMLQGQNIMFANSVGVYVLNGARAVKASMAMDGVYGTVANFGGVQLSVAHATVFNREVWMELVRIVDPVSGSTVNKLLMWDGAKKWWASEQDITLSFINSQEINSVFTAYGTNGTIVTPLFQTATSGFVKTVQSKLWDTPASYFSNKSPGRFWSLENYYSTVATGVSLILDSMAQNASTGSIVNNTNGYTITGPGITGFWTTPPMAASQQGILNGFTLKTNAADMALVSGMIDAKVTRYRG